MGHLGRDARACPLRATVLERLAWVPICDGPILTEDFDPLARVVSKARAVALGVAERIARLASWS